MIQRIQSLYLLVAAAFMFLFYLFPIATFTTNDFVFEFFNCHITHPENLEPPVALLPLAIIPFLSIVTSLFTVLMFKKRRLQLRLGKVNYGLVFLTLVFVVFYFFRINKMLATDFTYGFSIIFPILTLILIYLANKNIKKDEKLVRAADRIR